MNMWFLTAYILFFSATLVAQSVSNQEFDARLHKLLSLDVPTISVSDAKSNEKNLLFLDAREWNEYQVSHIPRAKYIGYDHFDIKRLNDIPKNQKIVIYCSVGYRSEKLTKKLIKAGFTDVSNLYGSIFEWANCGHSLQDASGAKTHRIHTYSRKWSRWVTHPDIQKVW